MQVLIKAAPFTAVHALSATGETPLYTGATQGKLEVVKLLLAKGDAYIDSDVCAD